MGNRNGCIKPKRKGISVVGDETGYFVGTTLGLKKYKVLEKDIADGKTVLAGYVDKNFFVSGSKCPHCGTSLAEAPVRNGRIRCPKYGTCYDILTGDLEDFPGTDALPIYEIKFRGTSVQALINASRMPNRVMREMAKCTDSDLRVVIIGTGAAGYTCAQYLRQEGYTGKITMVTKDKYLPYDRTKLNKELNCSFMDLKIRGASFYSDFDIEVILNTEVTKCDFDDHEILLSGNKSLQYDSLLISVGMKSRFYAPSFPGSQLKNIYMLSTLSDNIELSSKIENKEIVVSGSSFTAIELAQTLCKAAKTVHVLSRSKMPYGIVIGETSALAILNHIKSKLPNFVWHGTEEVKKFVGNSAGEVTEIYTTKKNTIKCDLVIVELGGLPNTEFLDRSQISLSFIDHSIIVNRRLETNVPNVYAGGDCVSFPFDLTARDRSCVGMWQVACNHGKLVALNMLGRKITVNDLVPFYYSNACGVDIHYIGYGEGYDETLIFGSVEELKFATVYRRHKRICAVCCFGCGTLGSKLALVFEREKEWTLNIPHDITELFPNPPVLGEEYHTIKNETRLTEHDLKQVGRLPPMMSYKEIESRTNYERSQKTDILRYDLYLQDNVNQPFAIEIIALQRAVQDRRLREKIRILEKRNAREKESVSS